MRSALMPLVMIWLAVHAALLVLILGLKFLTAKTVLLLAMAGAAFWLMTGRKRRPSLPAPSGMV